MNEGNELKTFRYLVAIAETGSLSKAAESLYISQPTLSHLVNQLETQLGVSLFERGKTGMKLTQSGKLVIETAKEIIENWEHTCEKLQRLHDDTSYVFSVPTFRGKYILSAIIKAVQEKFPSLDFAFEELFTVDVPRAFEDGRLNSAFTVGDTKPNQYYKNLLITTEEIYIIATSGHSIHNSVHMDNGRMWLEPERIAQEPLILLSAGHTLRTFAETLLAKHDMHVKKIIETTNIVTSFQVVRDGIGLALAPAMFKPDCEGLSFFSITKTGETWPLHLSISKHSMFPDVDRVIFKTIKAICRTLS